MSRYLGIHAFLLLFSLLSALEAYETPSMRPMHALERLMQGNRRYVEDKLLHPNRTQESRENVADKQRPYAIILGCSDSRVSPEIVFDEGIGDLFVVRVAGSIEGPIELESIEFAAYQLQSALIVVLGHEGCGAVHAVMEHRIQGIETIAAAIEPAIRASLGMPGDPLENAIKSNVRLVVDQLKNAPLIKSLIAEGKLEVVGGYYSLLNGVVTVFY